MPLYCQRDSYPTEEAARKAAEKKGYKKLQPKFCHVCGRWHLE